MLKIGSRVKSLLGGSCSDIMGIVLENFINVVRIQVEKGNFYYKVGDQICLYEKDLVLIKPDVDPTSPYQYCIKCDVLTSNKSGLCCDHNCSIL